MENNRTTRSLRVVDDQVPARDVETTREAATTRDVETAREDYWAQVQALREDLARLRPAN